MASSSSQRMVHQDYIARIRYSNALPPPPNPPKLLDIPNTGLASGQYTTPGFASRLARDQPLNIEADAELGMPLDLVGMPGIFDGDESCKSSAKKSGNVGQLADSGCSDSSAITSTTNSCTRSRSAPSIGISWKAQVLRFRRVLPPTDRVHFQRQQT